MAARTEVLRVSAGDSRGTGFLIDGAHAVTALHVVGRVADGALQLPAAVVLEGAIPDGTGWRKPRAVATRDDVVAYDADLDWICIRIDTLDGVRPLSLRDPTAADQSAVWSTYGFPEEAPADGKATTGTIASTAAVLTIRGVARRCVQVFANEIAAGGEPGGFSGAPVIVDGRAVAMLCAAQVDAAGAPQAGTLYAIPVAAIRAAVHATRPPAGARTTELAFAELARPGIAAALCLVTDTPAALVTELRTWGERLARDPLRAPALKELARRASLGELFAHPELRRDLLDRLAVTSFGAYVHYATVADDRIVAQALRERLRTRNRTIERVHARRDLVAELAAAVADIERTDRRTVAVPSRGRGAEPLLELAEVVLDIVARRLLEPGSEATAHELAYLRTRLRVVVNVATGEVHRREQNPLP